MLTRFFSTKQPTAAEIEKKREEISAKRQGLQDELQNMGERLIELDAERQDVAFEAIMSGGTDAEKRKEAIDDQKNNYNRRIAAGTSDLATMDALLSKMKSEMEQAQRREYLVVFDQEEDKILALCAEIQEHLAQLGPLLSQVRASAASMNRAGQNLTRAGLACESACVDSIRACIALYLDGVIPGLPSKAEYRKETIDAAESLQMLVRERIEAQRGKLTSAINEVDELQQV